MNEETASHVRAMAEKIERHAQRMVAEMHNLAYAAGIGWQRDMIDQRQTEEKFNGLASHWAEIQGVLSDMLPHMRELFTESQIVCEGCGNLYEPQGIEFPEQVNLKDGSTREITLCGECFDFWKDTKPGEWVLLVSGPYAHKQEVQRATWTCEQCQGVYPFEEVTFLEGSGIVCQQCEKEES